MAYDVVIIGAGIVGAACAERLSAEGLSVCVIEPGFPGCGATSAGMGHIVVTDDSDAQFVLTAYSRTLWHALAPFLPEKAEFDGCGTIWIASDEGEMAEAHRKRAYYAERGVEADILDEASLREAEPALSEHLIGGLFVPGDCIVYQPAATRCLVGAATRKGMKLISGLSAVGIGAGKVIMSDGSEIDADNVVIAAGSAAPELAPELPVTKRKGHLLVTNRAPGLIRHQIVEMGYLTSAHSSAEDSIAFNLQPRKNGQMLVGSSRQQGVEHGSVEIGIIKRMVARALEFVPKLADVDVTRIWTGFRPATPDNLPYIGAFAERPGVFAAAGHEGLGITTSLATAQMIADEIAGRESIVSRAPYSPGRIADGK